MGAEKRIAVIGATGAQGGGLARAILSNPEGGFRVRAVTRNPSSDRARELSEAGAEVVAADLDDLDSLVAAFQGCHGAFCVTNFWEHFSPEKELAQAKNLADAARSAELRHVVWSTLEDTREWVPLESDRMPTLQGRYKVPHFDAKGEANRFFTEGGVPVTLLYTTYYWDNLIHFGSEPQRGDDGKLVLVLPMGEKPLPGIAVEDIGNCTHGIFKAGDRLVGETVGIAGEHVTGAEMAEALGGVLGEPVRYWSPDWDTYRGFDFPGADDMGNMFQFYHDFNDQFTTSRKVATARSLHPGTLGFRDWLAKYGQRIPRH